MTQKRAKSASPRKPKRPNKARSSSSQSESEVPSTERKDGQPKVSGQAIYVEDLRFPEMLYAAVATSRESHAILDGVLLSNARAMPGVRAVMTAEDIPGQNDIGVSARDQPLLATDKVRWTGDRLALIAADTPREARTAATMVEGQYRPLEPVYDVEQALIPSAPKLHDAHPTGNLAAKGCVYKGDVKAGLKDADIVLEQVFSFGMQEHAYLETQGAVAVPENDGTMTIYGSMQCPFYVQGAVAGVLGLPLSRVRVIQTVTGGAFGGKEDYPSEPAACAALLAWRTKRPVQMVLNRTEDMKWSSKREAQRIRHRIGAKSDGTITAMEIDIFIDAGAYLGLASVVAERGNASVVGPYRVPHVCVNTHTVYTCNAFSGAFRGFGHPQVAVATESQIDDLARQLNMSPIEIREKNLLRAGDIAPTGERLPAPVEALDTLLAATKSASFAQMQQHTRAHNARRGRTKLGLGISTISYGCCLHAGGQFLEGAGALVQVHRDGSVSVAAGNTEIGQGALTVLAKIAADALGAAYEDVTVKTVDTDLVPDSGPTVASRTTTMSGNAVVNACEQLLAELRPLAAELLSASEDKITFANGFAKAGRKKLAFRDLAAAAFMVKRHLLKAGWYAPPRKEWDPATGQGQPYSAYAYATMVALVEVDTYTGRTRLKKVTAAHDVGKAIYPDGAVGQIEGGIVQGMGYALMERLRQEKGEILNPNFTDYIIPSVMDMPEVDVILIESAEVGPGQAAGPEGAKGLGEPSLIPICGAISNAIADALDGKRVYDMPFMPERVMDLLQSDSDTPDPLGLLPKS
jgi:CO/xanthine dehydrogenase Mo-binding subunit